MPDTQILYVFVFALAREMQRIIVTKDYRQMSDNYTCLNIC